MEVLSIEHFLRAVLADWANDGKKESLLAVTPEERATCVATLRKLADAVENNPLHVVSVAAIAILVDGDGKGLGLQNTVIGESVCLGVSLRAVEVAITSQLAAQYATQAALHNFMPEGKAN